MDPKRTTRANLENAPSPAMMSLKDYLRGEKNVEMPLDRDDLMAEDEMKKASGETKRDGECGKGARCFTPKSHC